MDRKMFVRFYRLNSDQMLVSAVIYRNAHKEVFEFYETFEHYRGALGKILNRLPKEDRGFPIIVDSRKVYEELRINRISLALNAGVKFEHMVNSYLSQSTARELSVSIVNEPDDFFLYYSGTMNQVFGKDISDYAHQLQAI